MCASPGVRGHAAAGDAQGQRLPREAAGSRRARSPMRGSRGGTRPARRHHAARAAGRTWRRWGRLDLHGHLHGRIYRITAEGRPLTKPAQIAGAPVSALLENLKSPDDPSLDRMKIELSGGDSKEVVGWPAQKWAAGLDKADKDYDHQLCEALWFHQWHNVVNEAAAQAGAGGEGPATPRRPGRARWRVTCPRHRGRGPAGPAREAGGVDRPPLRSAGRRRCGRAATSRFPAAQRGGAGVGRTSPTDKWVKYTLDEAMKTLEKHAK